MKKFLSLVLALVMTMSLVTVSAGAADFADAEDITYTEAVDVLSAIGVLEGDANGFRPADTLKRSEAAKIICALNLTPKTAATLSADFAPFADVAKSHWAAGYIAEGVGSGILAGVGDNKYDPDGQLTGYAFLKMLLVSLGYDAAIEGLTGANWSINVAKLADEKDLTDGNDDFVGSKAVTREEAALYAFNALKAVMVDYDDKGTQITINGAVIATGASKAKDLSSTKAQYGNINDESSATSDYAVQFGEKHFSKLSLTNNGGAGDFGRPTNTWYYDGKKVGSYDAKNPVLVLTETAKEKDIYSELGAEGISGASAKYVVMDAIYEDGNLVAQSAQIGTTGQYQAAAGAGAYGESVVIAKGDKSNTVGTGNGVTVEIYKTSKANHYTMVVIHEYITKVTGIVKANDSAETKRAIRTAYGTFETEEFAKNDWVLVTVSQGVVKSAALAEKIEDVAVTAYKGTTSVTADGVTYKYSQIRDELALDTGYNMTAGNTYTFYLDSNGYIIKNGVYTSSNTDYNQVLAVSAPKDDGFGGDKYHEYKLLTAEGKVEVVKAMDITAGTAVAAKNNLVTYTEDTDNEGYVKITVLPLYNAADSSTAGYVNGSAVTSVVKTTANIGGISVNNATTFVLKTGTNSYKVVEGLNNLDNYAFATGASATPYAVVKKGVALVLFLDVTSANASSESADLVYIISASYSTGYDAANKCNLYTYKAIVAGEETELTTVTSGLGVGLYEIKTTENGYAKGLEAKTDAMAGYSVKAVNGEVQVTDGVLTAGGSAYVLADDVEVIMIDADDNVTTDCAVDELADEVVVGTLYIVEKSTTNATAVTIYFDGTVG